MSCRQNRVLSASFRLDLQKNQAYSSAIKAATHYLVEYDGADAGKMAR